jgi:hypothetical protein
MLIDKHPGGQQLALELGATDPLPVEVVGRGQAQLDTLDDDGVHAGLGV